MPQPKSSVRGTVTLTDTGAAVTRAPSRLHASRPPGVHRRRAVRFGAYATLMSAADRPAPLVRGRTPFAVADIVPFSTFVTLTLLAVVVNQLLARERRRLRTAREVAEAVQRAVLPSPMIG